MASVPVIPNAPKRSAPRPVSSAWSLLALAGAILIGVGVLLPWASATSVTLDADAMLETMASAFGIDPGALPAPPTGTISQPVEDLGVAGKDDILGLVAAVGAVAAAVGALLAAGAPGASFRRLGGRTAAVGGVLALGAAIAVWVDPSVLVERELADQFREEARRSLDLFFPEIPFEGFVTGPLVADMVDALRDALTIEASAGAGVYLTLAGGAVAIVVGAGVSMSTARDAEEIGLAPVSLGGLAGQMDPRDRDELLRVLEAPDEVRESAARSFLANPERASWEPLLADLVHDERARRRVVEALRAARSTTAPPVPAPPGV